jgi:hypothetical protein
MTEAIPLRDWYVGQWQYEVVETSDHEIVVMHHGSESLVTPQHGPFCTRDAAKRWAFRASTQWSVVATLRDIEQRSRPRGPRRQASARAAYLAQHGLVKRTGYCEGGTVAEYELTPEGRAMLDESEAQP